MNRDAFPRRAAGGARDRWGRGGGGAPRAAARATTAGDARTASAGASAAKKSSRIAAAATASSMPAISGEYASLGSKRVIQRRFNVSVPRARVPKKASTLRGRFER